MHISFVANATRLYPTQKPSIQRRSYDETLPAFTVVRETFFGSHQS